MGFINVKCASVQKTRHSGRDDISKMISLKNHVSMHTDAILMCVVLRVGFDGNSGEKLSIHIKKAECYITTWFNGMTLGYNKTNRNLQTSAFSSSNHKAVLRTNAEFVGLLDNLTRLSLFKPISFPTRLSISSTGNLMCRIKNKAEKRRLLIDDQHYDPLKLENGVIIPFPCNSIDLNEYIRHSFQ